MSCDTWFEGVIADFVARHSRKVKSARPGSGRRSRATFVEALESRVFLSGSFTSGDMAVLQLSGTGNNTTGTVLELAPTGAAQTPALSVGISATGGSENYRLDF